MALAEDVTVSLKDNHALDPGPGRLDLAWACRIPNEIFGTIHGPGYNGGCSF